MLESLSIPSYLFVEKILKQKQRFFRLYNKEVKMEWLQIISREDQEKNSLIPSETVRQSSQRDEDIVRAA